MESVKLASYAPIKSFKFFLSSCFMLKFKGPLLWISPFFDFIFPPYSLFDVFLDYDYISFLLPFFLSTILNFSISFTFILSLIGHFYTDDSLCVISHVFLCMWILEQALFYFNTLPYLSIEGKRKIYRVEFTFGVWMRESLRIKVDKDVYKF
jgi:hypothetical protein